MSSRRPRCRTRGCATRSPLSRRPIPTSPSSASVPRSPWSRPKRSIRDGIADMVALTRAQIADPDLALKLRDGRVDSIRHCIRLNQGCLGRGSRGLPMSCTVNPLAGRELDRPARPPAAMPAAVDRRRRWTGGRAGGDRTRRGRPLGHAARKRHPASADSCDWPGRFRAATASTCSSETCSATSPRPASRCGWGWRPQRRCSGAQPPDGIVVATGAVAPRTTSLALGGAYRDGFPATGTVDAFTAASDPGPARQADRGRRRGWHGVCLGDRPDPARSRRRTHPGHTVRDCLSARRRRLRSAAPLRAARRASRVRATGRAPRRPGDRGLARDQRRVTGATAAVDGLDAIVAIEPRARSAIAGLIDDEAGRANEDRHDRRRVLASHDRRGDLRGGRARIRRGRASARCAAEERRWTR